MPPYKLADLESGTVSYASLEQQAIDYVVDSLRHWLVRTEQAYKQRLFTTRGDLKQRRYPEFLVAGPLRGDLKTRFEAYAIARHWGWMSVNDIRELENQPEIEGGDEYLVPMNMVPAGTSLDDLRAVGPELARRALANGHAETEVPTPSR